MVVHADGFIVHPEMWRDEFLDYDYIGSPWPIPKDDITSVSYTHLDVYKRQHLEEYQYLMYPEKKSFFDRILGR